MFWVPVLVFIGVAGSRFPGWKERQLVVVPFPTTTCAKLAVSEGNYRALPEGLPQPTLPLFKSRPRLANYAYIEVHHY